MEVVIKLRVPKDLAEDLRRIEEKDFSLFASRIIKEKLEKIISLYKEVKKSKLSKKEAKKISDMINRSLARKYLELYGKSK